MARTPRARAWLIATATTAAVIAGLAITLAPVWSGSGNAETARHVTVTAGVPTGVTHGPHEETRR